MSYSIANDSGSVDKFAASTREKLSIFRKDLPPLGQVGVNEIANSVYSINIR